MAYSPLLHGAAGILDELILAAEAVLVLALLVTFLRSRGQKHALPPADVPRSESPASDSPDKP